MQLGIISDIHGNLEALEAVMNALKKQDVEKTICLGDLVGYGPNPNECTEIILNETDWVVAGNHDRAVTGRFPAKFFNESAFEAIKWTQKVIKEQYIKQLDNLPLILHENQILLVHACVENPSGWLYITTLDAAMRNFMLMNTSICLIGHSHVPMAFVQDISGEIQVKNTQSLPIENQKRYIINVGSVGQPRDGNPKACYSVLDLKEQQYTLHRIPYNISKVQNKMRECNLPSYLIERLVEGI